jgi:hypothetical protein
VDSRRGRVHGMRFKPGFVGASVTVPPAAPDTPSVTFIGSAISTASATTYTFAAQGIGDSFTSRIVAVALHCGAGSNPDISGVTIAGSSCAVIRTTGCNVGLAHLGVPSTSTAADVVVTLTGAAGRCAIGVWSIVGMGSTTPLSSTAPLASSSTLHSVNVDVPSSASYGVAAATIVSNLRFGWTNATEQYDVSFGGGNGISGATINGSLISTGTVVVTATHSVQTAGIVGATWTQ